MQKINNELLKSPVIPVVKINLNIFVMLLPVGDSNKLKEEVIKWIETKEPLI